MRSDYTHGSIYVLRNRVNGKMYVGQTVQSIEDRITVHRSTKNMIIGRAIRKYGIASFDVFSFSGIPFHVIDYAEIEMIRRLGTLSPAGYNVALGGAFNHGGLSPEHRAKIGAKSRGRHLSEESRQKIRAAALGRPSRMKGRHHSEEARRRMSVGRMGVVPWNKGIRHRAETIEKMKASLKGRLAPNKRRIVCVETDEIFESVRLASVWATGSQTGESNIATVCRGRWKTAYGYHWKYAEAMA